MDFQGLLVDRPLSDPLRHLPWSIVPRLSWWSASEWDHHRWGLETSGLCHRCHRKVAPGSRAQWDVSSNQAGLRPVPGNPLLSWHGQCDWVLKWHLWKVSVNSIVIFSSVYLSFLQGPCWNLTCFPPDIKCFGLCDVGTVLVPLMHNDAIKQQPANFLDLEKAYSDFATEFITTSAKKKQPFFLYYPSHVSNRFAVQ